MIGRGAQLDIDELQRQLDTSLVGAGGRLIYIPVTESTNTLAMDLARQGSEEGMVILTDSQTAGKGRQGRHWVDVSGCNVLSSTVLQPVFQPHLLVMIASLAVVSAIEVTCGIDATIKWPNDILVNARKVAGILIETSHDAVGRLFAVIGIGVNVNGSIEKLDSEAQISALYRGTLSTTATTLESECGHTVDRETFIACLLRHIETDYLALQQEATSISHVRSTQSSLGPNSRLIRDRWRGKLVTLGRAVEVRQGSSTISGTAENVNETGELLLRSHSGEVVIVTWGDVDHPTR